VALGTHDKMRMHHIFICDLFGAALFSALSHKQYDFLQKNIIEHTLCV